jgi:hypothetical protein
VTKRLKRPRARALAPLPGAGLDVMRRRNKPHADRRREAARRTCRGEGTLRDRWTRLEKE